MVGGHVAGGGLLDEAEHPAVVVCGHHPVAGRVLDGRQGDGSLCTGAAVGGDQAGHVQVGQDVAVQDEEGVVDAGVGGGEADGAGGVERFGLDGVVQRQPCTRSVRVGVGEGVR